MSNAATTYVALMYHGIFGNQEEYQALPDEEKPYAISAENFAKHLEQLKTLNIEVLTHEGIKSPSNPPNDRYKVLITFDDGDKGWIKYGLPLLKKHGYQGTFFVTSQLIDSFDHFCDWADITQLANEGMCVQSHGNTHRFLADLLPEQVSEEYTLSKSAIETATGTQVDTISFPGGRFQNRDIEIGQQKGYQIFHTSVVGVNRLNSQSNKIKRIAVRIDTSADDIGKIATQDKRTLLKLVWIYKIKTLVKQLLGNMGYHRLYKLIKS